MIESQHPDEVARLRIALWGDQTALGDDAALHVETCAECGDDVAFNRRLRDVFRRWAGAEASVGAIALAKAAALDPDELRAVDWITAVPVDGVAGVRSAATADVHVVCNAGGVVVDVVLHCAGTDGRFAVSGQAVRNDFTPAAGVEVILFVDRRRAAESKTDAFGEFAFDTFAGERWGLRVGSGSSAAHIEIRTGAGDA